MFSHAYLSIFGLAILLLASLNFICSCVYSFCSFRFFTSAVSLFRYFTLLGLSVLITFNKSTLFALTTTSIFGRGTFIKLGSGFNYLASIASFCFNRFRHGFLLVRKLRLEPLQTQYLCGSAYYINSLGSVNGK